MPSASRFLLLTLFVFAGASVGLWAQQTVYYADCQICATKLGAEGRIGPFYTLSDCQAARAAELAQSYPFDECRPYTTATPGGTSGRPSSAVAGIAKASLFGGAADALLRNMMSENDIEKTKLGAAEGMSGGAAVGCALNAGHLPAAATGACVGVGVGVAALANGRIMERDGTQDAEKTKSNALKFGALAGFAAWGLDEVAKAIAPGVHFPRGMGVAVMPRQIWMRWLW